MNLDLRWNLFWAKRAYRKARKNEAVLAAKIADLRVQITAKKSSPDYPTYMSYFHRLECLHRHILRGLEQFEKRIDLMQRTLEALNA
jgi:hypothetical protein